MTSSELHAQVDKEYKALIDSIPEALRLPMVVGGIFATWRDEKKYIDRYGTRIPTITGISIPR